MIRKNQFLPRLFDSFSFLGPKGRKQLEQSWAGTFRRHILPHLPVEELSQEYRQDFGRPSKNLHTGLGVLVLQQLNDTTDEESLQRLTFDTRWQYALNIHGTSDEELYMCPRTLVELRQKAIKLGLEEKLFAQASDGLIAAGGVGVGQQRMDSVHVQSNMKRLGRLRLVGRTIQAFLKNLRRKDVARYEQVEGEVRQRYLGLKRGEDIFSRVKPSETAGTLGQAAQDLCYLVEQFTGEVEVGKMHSYQMMQRVLREQCRVVEGEGEKQVEVKAAKEVSGDSLQNPSDEDAGYSGHKGQGYTMQMMETFHGEEEERPRLITYVEVTSAAVSDHHAVEPALEKVKERGVLPHQMVADTLYGSDENVQAAAREGVELVAPVANTGSCGKIPLAAFEMDEQGVMKRCPGGQAPVRIRVTDKGVTVWFELRVCEGCAKQKDCPTQRSRKRVRLYYDKVAMRSSQRRQMEGGEEFREKYRMRSGIESSFSQLDRRTGVKHLRVRGMKAVRFCVFLKALGLNILRFAAWLAGGGVELGARGGKAASERATEGTPAIFLNILGGSGAWRAFWGWPRSIQSPVLALVAESLSVGMVCLYFLK